ncbi:MAG: hypothetical protein ACRC49_00555, partial [Plesiomonas sp.]
MKIIGLILLIALQSWGALNLMTWDGSASSNFNDTANWTGTVAAGSALGVGDSCLMNSGSVAATASTNVSVGSIITTSGYSGALSFSGRTIQTVGNCFFDNASTLNLGNGYTITGKGTFHVNPSSALTATACGLVLGDEATDTIVVDIDKSGAAFKSKEIKGYVTNSGTANVSYTTTTKPLIISNNANYSNNASEVFYITTSGRTVDMASTATWRGTGSIALRINGNGLTDSMQKIRYTGSGVFTMNGATPGSVNNLILLDTLDLGLQAALNISGSSYGYNAYLNYPVICGAMTTGSSTSGTNRIIWGAVTHNIGSYDASTGSNATSFDSLKTTIINCRGNFLVAATRGWFPGTSTINLIGAAAQTFTSGNQPFYDITLTRATTGTCTFADTLKCHTLTVAPTNTQAVSCSTIVASGDISLQGTGNVTLRCCPQLTG